MRPAFVLALALTLGACTPAQNEQAHQTADQAKHDAKSAAHDIKVETEKASKELDADLKKARDKVRGALDQPADNTKAHR